MSCSLVLFTRDLRVRDNAALSAAAGEAERVLPLFVLDEKLLGGSCGAPNRVAHLRDCLADLDASLRERGARLVLRRGDPVREAVALARETGARALHLSADVSGYARRRQARLGEACREHRIELHAHPGVMVAEPGAVVPTGGDHYRVFTPYFRAWSELPRRPVLAAPRKLELPAGVAVGRLPALESLGGGGESSSDLLEGGESAGRARLQRWLRGGLAGYEEERDDLAGASTSRLSADLHFGTLSPNELLERVEGHPGGASFARQLCWRDFHHQVLSAFPDLPRADYRRRGKRWRRDEEGADRWSRGLTGIPIVDAGMRQLSREGFMHNRTRMLVASFLTKSMGLDWRIGARHFEALLSDADVANNSGNWQWVAGTGNDTRPNRVLNPLRQAYRFDPDGSYVRRHLPELAAIEGSAVHEPWKLAEGVRGGLDYPDPIVEP